MTYKKYLCLYIFDGVEGNPNLNRTSDTPETTGNDLSVEMKTYYQKRLIELAEGKLVHDQFGDKYPIPKNGGKTTEFRRYEPLGKAMTPITEGVTPDGNKLNVKNDTVTVEQYGDYITLSDQLILTAIDNNIVQATKLLASQAGRTLDTVTREVLSGGTNVRYAPKKVGGNLVEVTERSELDATSLLTPDLIFRAKADLAAMNADTIDDSYVGIIHPYVAYDLMRNPEWIDVHKYARPENIYKGEIGKIGGVRFVETSEAKIWGGVLPFTSNADNDTNLKVSGTATMATQIAPPTGKAYTAKGSADNPLNTPVVITTSSKTVHAKVKYVQTNKMYIERISGDTLEANDVCTIRREGTASDGGAVFSTLILGAHAYGITEVTGGGLEHITKPLGYGNDPLNQRAACGWKAIKAVKRLVEPYMVRIESCSAYSGTAEAN